MSRYLEQNKRAASKDGNDHSLEQAVDNPMPRLCQNDDATSWDETIKNSVVQVMNYIIEQKFALMKEEVNLKITMTPAESIINTGRNIQA